MSGMSLLRSGSGSRSWCQCRRWMASHAVKMAAEEKHALATMVTWRRVSLFIAIPVCGYLGWKKIIVGEKSHTQDEYKPWAHLRIRNKPFPWGDGDTSLFHNPHTNLGPEKPEKEIPPKQHYSSFERLWMTYMFEDPEELDRQRWEHLKKMQKRKEEFLRKKKVTIDTTVPLQPIDLFKEFKLTAVNPKDSGMEN